MGAQGFAGLGTAEETTTFPPVFQDRAPGSRTGRTASQRVFGRHLLRRLPAAGYRFSLALLDFSVASGVALFLGDSPARAVLTGTALATMQAVTGRYRLRRSLSLVDEVAPSMTHLLLADLAVNRILLAPEGAPLQLATVQVAAFVLAALLLVLAGRIPVFEAARRFRARPERRRATAVIGTGEVADRLAAHLDRHAELGLTITARLDPHELDEPTPRTDAAEDWPELTQALRRTRIRVVLVLCEGAHPVRVDAAARAAARYAGEVWAVVSTPGVVPAGARGREFLAGVPVVRILDATQITLAHRAKRLFDLAVASALVMALGWLMLTCAVAVRLEGGPGVLFRQRRIGRLGREFTLVKFRTVRPSTEHHGDTSWSVDHQRLVGPVGRFLRKSSLDELPQLWNVIRGDMSLVGPRPERPHFVATFGASVPNYRLRHRMPVGMTGWAQVNGLRGDTSIEDRVRYDNYYIDHWSFAADLRILLMTVRSVIVREGR
ncbi:exopolysaccharide biosynthesis polyprenyl glycosylphosphotransferase [Actinomadura rupiterrae]|uniref:exopolysaccharide biosynthesis polyprenyl glycosylphosphotransferase n=1 Tax=Actinomadura rupiterrae TaxID=559627 RepID=UPI0020A4E724|nr:exopolysaccharide biosynthesis polyprenyl glycosylphosphotransferase [Actinomadura rupiterrae]MCP2335171.1 exopolysaccharide biosynthesis polyprenyl glycosylphosphotransferase [Actinomadura rupiterrae]